MVAESAAVILAVAARSAQNRRARTHDGCTEGFVVRHVTRHERDPRRSQRHFRQLGHVQMRHVTSHNVRVTQSSAASRLVVRDLDIS